MVSEIKKPKKKKGVNRDVICASVLIISNNQSKCACNSVYYIILFSLQGHLLVYIMAF